MFGASAVFRDTHVAATCTSYCCLLSVTFSDRSPVTLSSAVQLNMKACLNVCLI